MDEIKTYFEENEASLLNLGVFNDDGKPLMMFNGKTNVFTHVYVVDKTYNSLWYWVPNEYWKELSVFLEGIRDLMSFLILIFQRGI
jgi:hypothetical protein